MDVSSLKAADDISTFFDWIPHRGHVFEKVKPAAEHATTAVQATYTTTLMRSIALFLIAAGLLGESEAASAQRGRSFDSQAFDFVLEIAGHVVGAMIVTQLQATRHSGRDGSEAAMHPLAHRLQGLEAIGRPRCMNADDFRVRPPWISAGRSRRRGHRVRVLSGL